MDPRVRELEDLVSSNIPDLVYLMEVKVDRKAVENVQCLIHFEGMFYITHVNSGGSLAFLWRKQDTIELNKFARNFIDVIVMMWEKSGDSLGSMDFRKIADGGDKNHGIALLD